MKTRVSIPWGAALVVVFGLIQTMPAKADTIGPNCATCQGATYTLTYGGAPLSGDAVSQIFQVTLTIDTSGYTGGGGFIDAVAIKVSSSELGSTLVAAPGGAAAWVIVPGGIDASGCSGSGGGFSCADWVSGAPVGTAVGGVLAWTFDQEVPTGTLFTGLDESSIKVRYVDAAGEKVGDLVSEGITLQQVPESTSLLLLGLGLAGVGLITRRTHRP